VLREEELATDTNTQCPHMQTVKDNNSKKMRMALYAQFKSR
jgi:hypothetical protein